MRIATHLTIQDYFTHSNSACFKPTTGSGPESIVDKASGAAPFLTALDKARTNSKGTTQGLTIQDYMQRRIACRSAIAKLSSATVLQSPISPSGPVSREDHTVLGPKSDQKAVSSAGPLPQENAVHENRLRISTSIEKAATEFGLPAALINAVVKAESNYQVRALSPAGAQGLMQLMPATARELGVTDPFDIDQNIRGGAQYLRNMLDQFDGDVRLALSAYNAGPGTVARYAGNVPYAETRAYVQRVLRYADQFSSSAVT
jgi:Transglycosylase SLT domain